MRLDTGQHLRLGQHMKLAPRMIQSMEILQMPMLALEERIEQELEKNIALELLDPEADEAAIDAERREREREDRAGERELTPDVERGAADFERLDDLERTYEGALDSEYSDYQPPRRLSGEDAGEAKMDAMANTAARGASLTEQLQDQWSLADAGGAIRRAGAHIINYIDDDGYLRTPIETIADQAPQNVSRADIEAALPIVQSWLEPPGVGARDLRECLLIQLDALDREFPGDDDRSIQRTLVDEYLPDIESNRIPKIAQRSGLTVEEIKNALDHLRHLDPRPGRRLAPESPNVVIPDAIVEYDEASDNYIAASFSGRLPNLRVNPDYATMARDRSVDKETRKFVDDNVREARWLLEAIEQRQSTLLRVIRAVIAHQRDFFDLGAQALKPLPMTQVAEQLGVHVATISRAVNGKWIQTPRGVLPLRKFFTAGTETDEGEEVSWDAIKETLKEIVENEDKSKPLGDDALASALKERGLNIARRTVAKYRDQLGIPAARLRREY